MAEKIDIEKMTLHERLRLEKIEEFEKRGGRVVKCTTCSWPIPIVHGMTKKGDLVMCQSCRQWTRDPLAQPPPPGPPRPDFTLPEINTPTPPSGVFEVQCPECGKVHVVFEGRDRRIACVCGVLYTERQLLELAGDSAHQVHIHGGI